VGGARHDKVGRGWGPAPDSRPGAMETEGVGRRSLPCRVGEKESGGGDEDINTSATIIPSVEILVPITRS
jgi:hypothetical protein